MVREESQPRRPWWVPSFADTRSPTGDIVILLEHVKGADMHAFKTEVSAFSALGVILFLPLCFFVVSHSRHLHGR